MVELGYLLPTREKVMGGEHDTRELLDSAREAEQLGFNSIWAGDSLLARPRHDPLTLLAAVAGALPDLYVGTAVLLPALRNPVVLAQQLATLDQLSDGKLIVGAGIAADAPSIRAEFTAAGVPFEKRVGRLMEGFRLCRALWTGEPVSWDGRWQLEDAVLAPLPKRPGGPLIWLAAGVDAGIVRAAKHFDGWFPIGPDAAEFGRRQQDFNKHTEAAGRSPQTTALYLTLAIDDNRERADQAIKGYLETYYGVPAQLMRTFQACCGGPLAEVLAFVRAYVEAGAQHLVIRCVGDHQQL
ncbi:MAG: LLM class flavin-dependent oxidoreductase, partial [Pseudomonadota bacterium]